MPAKRYYSPPPPGPRPPPTPDVPEGAGKEGYTARFQGVVRVYTCEIPDDSIIDVSSTGINPIYVTCWIDGQRGKSAHVSFQSRSHPGTFTLDLNLKDGDPDKLKIQLCMRMLDTETGNRRSAELGTSYACIQPMMLGQIDEFVVPNTFSPGNKVQVAMSLGNASDFRNHPDSATDMHKPLLRFTESKIDYIDQFNAHVNMVSATIGTNNGTNRTKMPPGGDAFQDGTTRCSPLFLLAL